MHKIWGMSGMIMRGVEKIFNFDYMRTNLELWLIVEQNFDEYFVIGLCDTIRNLYKNELLTREEELHLRNIIYQYGKRRFSHRKGLNAFTYYELIWRKNEKKPRRMFIQNQILKLIRDEKK